MTKKRPVILAIMDGWGHREEEAHNAVSLAKTPVVDGLDKGGIKSLLLASGEAVGLPEGQVGNSEVGHMTIGAGRVILQDLRRIDMAIADGSLTELPTLENFIKSLKTSGGRAHLMGLISSGGVHSRDAHILALAEALVSKGVEVILHAFTDGRDTLPKLALESLPKFVAQLPKGITLGTVVGRYYAMDRDNRWERTESAWRALTFGTSQRSASDAEVAVSDAYAAGLGDEFIEPTVIGDYAGMADGDGVLMANFRADRVRQLMAAFCFDEMATGSLVAIQEQKCGFDISGRPQLHRPLGLVPFAEALTPYMDTLITPPTIKNTLGEVVAEAGLKQLRLAETEKYPHVTFFLNGGSEQSQSGEERTLIASPHVKTYDLAPQMSAKGVLDALLAAIKGGESDLIIVNFANPDMVGHTGSLEATIKAVETVDKAMGEVIKAVNKAKGVMLLTSDHGNCEVMWDSEADCPHTAHSYNPVPFYLIGGGEKQGVRDGTLADIAPTLLDLLGIEQPQEMSGTSLLTNLLL